MRQLLMSRLAAGILQAPCPDHAHMLPMQGHRCWCLKTLRSKAADENQKFASRRDGSSFDPDVLSTHSVPPEKPDSQWEMLSKLAPAFPHKKLGKTVVWVFDPGKTTNRGKYTNKTEPKAVHEIIADEECYSMQHTTNLEINYLNTKPLLRKISSTELEYV